MTQTRAGFVRTAFTLFIGLALLASVPPARASGSNDAALVMDAESGRVLYARSADAPRAPASLTKIMTLYMLFDYMDATGAKLTDTMTASANAAAQKPTKLGVKAGESITLEQAILGLVIQSANDVAVVVAEHIGGNVPNFAKMMTQKARAIGMRHTIFRNPSGLPDQYQVTTARDMAILSRSIMRNHPHMYLYFSATSFTYKNKTTRTHNRVLLSLGGANGIKTGYTRLSGFNLTTSAQRNGKRLIGVVMGGDSWASRDNEMKTMMEAWFDQLQRRPELVAAYTGKQPRSIYADTITVAEAAPEPEEFAEEPAAVAEAEPAAPPPAPVAVAAVEATPVDTGAADARRIMAMAPIPDEAVAPAPTPAPEAKPARTMAVAYDVPVPSAKPRTIARADTRKAKKTEVAEGDTGDGVVVPRAKPGKDETLPLNTLASDNPDDIAALIAAGYSPEGGTKSAKIDGTWGIQVGAFDSKKDAQTELKRARKTAAKALKPADDAVMAVKSDSKTLYRARFTGLTNKQATAACKALKAEKFKCVTFSSDTASAN